MSAQAVLMTGALTGIGRAAAVAFAKRGAKVVVAGRRDDAGKQLVDAMVDALWNRRKYPTSTR
jgi:NAD(P)-dependent dehydrogenase (short-subunit alcohol dehydrogenase family)